MSDFNFSEVQPFIFVLLGVILSLIAIFKKTANANLKTSGLKAGGIVFKKDYSKNPMYDNTINVKDKITVRFITNKDEWITADIQQGFAIFFTKQYKEGQALDIYYDPENP